MKIRIYQINNERDDLNVAFLNLENLQHIQGSKELESRIYDQVYEGKVDCKSLENVYEKFNIDFPSDFHSRSLSVSDVVEVIESDNVKKGFYFCDSVGFVPVKFDPAAGKKDLQEYHSRAKAPVFSLQESPYDDDLHDVLACPRCGSGEFLHNEDGVPNRFCGQCGQAIDWGDE